VAQEGGEPATGFTHPPAAAQHRSRTCRPRWSRTYDRPGRYTVAVKVIDIFGNDTVTLIPVHVG
jgi:hypothetical protein